MPDSESGSEFFNKSHNVNINPVSIYILGFDLHSDQAEAYNNRLASRSQKHA
jgi:hypothetical protein